MKGLLIVDVQLDFLPGGALAAPEGHQIIPHINKLLELPFDVVIATKDWHPKDHGSFAEVHGKKVGEHTLLAGVDQILWPVHCVQASKGAEFSPLINTKKFDEIVYKGIDKNIDSYSAFFDNVHRRDTGLNAILKKRNVDEIYIAGLVTDYCVKYSVIDALHLGYRVFVVKEGCRAVNLQPDDEKNAYLEMERLGAHVISIEDVIV